MPDTVFSTFLNDFACKKSQSRTFSEQIKLPFAETAYSDFQLGETFKSERGRLVRQRSEMTLLAYPPASLLVSVVDANGDFMRRQASKTAAH